MEFFMKTMFTAVQSFIADENGVTAIEYGLIAALVGVAMAGAAKLLGEEIKTTFANVVTSLKLALAP
jgi:pilus assembly protein Flp/PilA